MPDIEQDDYEMHKRFIEQLDAKTHPKQALMEEEMSRKLKLAEQQGTQCKKMESITEKLKAAWIEREKINGAKDSSPIDSATNQRISLFLFEENIPNED